LDFANKKVLQSKKIDLLGERMILGLTVDPQSTAARPILWASHSSIAQYDGEANSGVISKIDVAANTKVDVITGLPRALNNHATNQIHFEDDGLLYINQVKCFVNFFSSMIFADLNLLLLLMMMMMIREELLELERQIRQRRNSDLVQNNH
jgi:hypothetical protein